MRVLIELAARHPVFSNLLMVTLLLGGITAAVQLRREMFPEFAMDQVKVTVSYPYAQPEEVEEAICIKIEEAVEGLDGIKQVNSTASENMGTVVIEFEAEADSQTVLGEIKNKVDSITTFPEDAEKPLISEIFRRDHVINLVVYGDATEKHLKEVARNIKDELRILPGITNVVWSGVREYEIAIEVSEPALRKYGLTFTEVAAQVRLRSINLPGGTIRTEEEQVKLQTKSRRYTGTEYQDMVLVGRPDGTLIYLRDVATIVDGFEEDELFARFNGKSAVMLQVYKTPDQDSVIIANQVQKYYQQKKDKLPGNLQLAIWSNRSRFIHQRLAMLSRNGELGFILVVLALWLFLSLRLSLWVALGIPISFGGGFLMLWLFGHSFNMISSFALIMALGLVVDDAIVVGENIYTRQQQGLTGLQGAITGAVEMAGPVTAAVATTVIAFAPLFFVTGSMGKFIGQVSMAVTVVLLTSLIECLFILPAHLRHQPPVKKGWRSRVRNALDTLVQFIIYRIYKPVYYRALEWRMLVVALVITLSLIPFGLLRGGFIKAIFFPKLDEDTIIAKVVYPQGTPASVTKKAVQRIERMGKKLNRVFRDQKAPITRQMLSTVGEIPGLTRSIGSHLGSVTLELSDPEVRSVHSDEVVKVWRKMVGEIPGIHSLSFSGPGHGPGGAPIEIILLAKDFQNLRAAANDLKQALRQFEGVYDIEDDYTPGKRELIPAIKQQGRALGLSAGDIGWNLFRGYAGLEVMRLQRGADEVKVKVRYQAQERKNLANLQQVRIRKYDREIPFTEVAQINMRRAPAIINREDRRRRIRVSADVNQFVTPAGKILEVLSTQRLPQIMAKYPGVTYAFAGQQEEEQESISSLIQGFFFALLGIFAVLTIVFRSYVQPMIIMLIIPFGVSGALYGHWILGHQFVIMSIFGIVALAGVVVNDALVFIDRINVGMRNGLTVVESVRQAGPIRFRAIMLTTITTFAGLAPIMFETSFQAQFIIPMAVSLGCGLVYATLLTLFLVPCMFLYLNSARRIVRWLWTGKWPTREEVEPAIASGKFDIGAS